MSSLRLQMASPDQHNRIFLMQSGKPQNLRANLADSQKRVYRYIARAICLGNERLGGDARPAQPLVLRLVNVVGCADTPQLGWARLTGIEDIQ